MSKKPNQTEARRREPTSISHHPSAGTPFLFPSAAIPAVGIGMLPLPLAPVSSEQPAERTRGLEEAVRGRGAPDDK